MKKRIGLFLLVLSIASSMPVPFNRAASPDVRSLSFDTQLQNSFELKISFNTEYCKKKYKKLITLSKNYLEFVRKKSIQGMMYLEHDIDKKTVKRAAIGIIMCAAGYALIRQNQMINQLQQKLDAVANLHQRNAQDLQAISGDIRALHQEVGKAKEAFQILAQRLNDDDDSDDEFGYDAGDPGVGSAGRCSIM